MNNEDMNLNKALLLAVERAEQASLEASFAAKSAEKAAKKAKKAVNKVKKAKSRIKKSEKEMLLMQELAEENNTKYQEGIIEIITKAKKKKKALKKIAKLNQEKNQ